MNQAASATRRSPADSVGAAGCCPMFNTSFFGINASAMAPQCYLSSQTQRLVQLARQPQQLQQQSNVVLPPQQQTVSQPPANLVGQQQQHQPQQSGPQRSQQNHLNNYSTSITTQPGLSLQHLLASRHPASSCMALAAALATASFPHFQQQQQPLAQNHQQATPINQPPQAAATSTHVNPVTQSNAALTNQVPLLNYNSYPQAQPFLNLPALTVPQPAPPVAAHLNSNTGHQQQQQQVNNVSNILPNNLTITANGTSNLQQTGSARPLVANTTLNSSGPQQTTYRNAQQQPVVSSQSTAQPINVQQQPSTPTPTQQLGQVTRSILSDDALNSLFNEQFQAMLLNQLLSNNQFAPLTGPAAQMQSQQLVAPQQPVNATSRTQLPLAGQQAPAMMTSAQHVASAQTATSHQQAPEQASDNQQQGFNHPNIQSRVPQAQTSTTITNDSYSSSANSATNSMYQQTQQSHEPQIHRTPVDPVNQTHQSASSLQPHQQQTSSNIPPLPYYAIPQMESALALLTNPQVANNIFSHVFNIYLQTGLRSETHHSQPNQHPQNFHLHGSHHQHHHNGQNNQANGQDGTMPLDSLAINESKPRGLNRAEIDSLTPYIHTNEKDASTCVICLSKFELKSKIRPLPCNHAFHAKCVDKWLRANRTCPICRRDALKTFNGKIKRI